MVPPMHKDPMTDTKLIANAAQNLDAFREWLRHEIAKSADVGYVGADFTMSIDQMGMSSIHVVRLTGEIEKLLGLELDPSFMVRRTQSRRAMD